MLHPRDEIMLVIRAHVIDRKLGLRAAHTPQMTPLTHLTSPLHSHVTNRG